MRGTSFNNIHSFFDLGLLQASFEIGPASAKTNYLDIEGGDGSLDLTEALGRVFYRDRTLSWTFKLYPEQDWETKQIEVSNALNGKHCKIVLDSDTEHYFDGRVFVGKYEKDKLLHVITVTATVKPYKFKREETIYSIEGDGTLYLQNSRRPVCPSITCTKETTIIYNDGKSTATLLPGMWQLLDLQLVEGMTSVTVQTEGIVTFKYQEGDL